MAEQEKKRLTQGSALAEDVHDVAKMLDAEVARLAETAREQLLAAEQTMRSVSVKRSCLCTMRSAGMPGAGVSSV